MTPAAWIEATYQWCRCGHLIAAWNGVRLHVVRCVKCQEIGVES